MTSALVRGRTLNRRAVAQAERWRQQRIKVLEEKRGRSPLLLSRRERHELSRIGGTVHPYRIEKKEEIDE